MTLKEITNEMRQCIKERKAISKMFTEMKLSRDAAYNAGYAEGLRYALFMLDNRTVELKKN